MVFYRFNDEFKVSWFNEIATKVAKKPKKKIVDEQRNEMKWMEKCRSSKNAANYAFLSCFFSKDAFFFISSKNISGIFLWLAVWLILLGFFILLFIENKCKIHIPIDVPQPKSYPSYYFLLIDWVYWSIWSDIVKYEKQMPKISYWK